MLWQFAPLAPNLKERKGGLISSFVDLTGQRFGKLLVVKRDEDYISPKGHHNVKWFCKCDCGNTTSITSSAIRKGQCSCGCDKEEKISRKKHIDLIGLCFGRLTVEAYLGSSRFKCRCECGQETIVDSYNLRNGHTQSCGCLSRELTSKRSLQDLTGLKFGNLTVISRADSRDDKNKAVMWNCICDCGKNTIVRANDLRSGNTKSCGCLKGENHGLSGTRLYHVWSTMKDRCYNPNSTKYVDYGGRGIEVCDEWKNSFVSFYKWALSSGYDFNALYGDCTIDRKDVNGDYCPGNCRWVNQLIQANNRRTTRTQ